MTDSICLKCRYYYLNRYPQKGVMYICSARYFCYDTYNSKSQFQLYDQDLILEAYNERK